MNNLIFSNNRNISDYYLTKEIGYSYLSGSKNPDKVYAHIVSFDSKAFDKLSIELMDGRLPQNEDEIVVPRHLKTNGGIDYKIGDNITLEIGKRYSENYTLDQNNPYTGDEEKFKAESVHTYKIVGVIERPGKMIEPYTAPGYTFITKLDTTSYTGKYDVYTKYTNEAIKDRFNVTASILGVDSKMYERYEKPLFIVENGFGAIDKKEEDGSCHDPYRVDYLRAHIEQMKKAVEIDGVDLMGYTPWGCIDCVSFTTGEMKKRYGFIYVDRNNDGSGTLVRSKKDSFDWYKKVVASNGEDLG